MSENISIKTKYNPKKTNDLILLDRIEKKVKLFYNKGIIPENLIFYGNYGLGKTSLAKILAKDFSPDEYLYLNGSLQRRIEDVRNSIVTFLETISLGKFKTIIIDEFEMFTNDAQKSLKSILNDYDKYAKFILTTNNINQIDSAIRSRSIELNFNPLNEKEKKELRKKIAFKIKFILDNEKIFYSNEERKFIGLLINSYFPDIRKIMEMISLSVNNKKIVINEDLIMKKDENNYKKIIESGFFYARKKIQFFNEMEAKTFSNYLLKEYYEKVPKEKKEEYFKVVSNKLNFWYSTFDKNMLLINIIQELHEKNIIKKDNKKR